MSKAPEQQNSDDTDNVKKFTILPTPDQGKNDWRQFRAFRLNNGVTCLAVHDKESKTTGMATLVGVGAGADPRELSGLAHFCEHMCFLGSEKYPGENEYKRYLSSHGGRSNASTSMHTTNYKAEVVAEHAEQAFDIFSHFFVAPLFTLSGTSREVNAIDSENSKNLTSDARRRLQILKALADPNHYYSKFSTGHAQTLDTEERLEFIREALLAFHRKHYQPSKMTVVLAGPQSLDELQSWIVERFSQIKVQENHGPNDQSQVEKLIEEAAMEVPLNKWDEPPPPFDSPWKPEQQGGAWPILLTTKPLKSMRKLVLLWPIPSGDPRVPDQSASSILSHLLGHEGHGSVFANLQNRGLISSLSAGPRTSAPDFALFQVNLELTAKGEIEWKEVVNTIFAYCRLLQDSLESDQNSFVRIWGETIQLDQMFFHQSSPSGVYSYAPSLADRIHSYGTKNAVSVGSLLNETHETFPLNKVKEVVKMLVPSNCIVERCSNSAWEDAMNIDYTEEGFGKKTEQWYGVDYHISSIDRATVSSWKGTGSRNIESDVSALHLPKPNRYIPRTLKLCEDLPKEATEGPRLEKSIDPPSLLVDDYVGRLYHRLDDRYALPKSSLTFLIRNGAVHHIQNDEHWKYDDESALLSSMLIGAFNEAMAQETYDADLAGLHWSLNAGSTGIKMSLFGFSDRLPDLAMTILQNFLAGKFIQEKFFVSTKDRIIRSLKTYFQSRRADSHAVYYRDALLVTSDKGIDESLHNIEKMKLCDVEDYFKIMKENKEFFFESLCTGNISQEEARKFYHSATTLWSEHANVELDSRSAYPLVPRGVIERQIKPGEDIELHFASKNPQEENGAIVCSYQSCIPSFKGDHISHSEGLESTAAIRLLSHMLREPLFDDLRTKQQLGYVVSTFYELGQSSRPNEQIQSLGPLTVPVDFITVVVLSRKLAPPDILERIDSAIQAFRESLLNMPLSEINDHAEALSTMLLKPIPKLQTEASNHFSKIERYGPELFYRRSKNNLRDKESVDLMPWNSVKSLAKAIKHVSRDDLLKTLTRMTDPSSRSRIVSCVYGNTFPLEESSKKIDRMWPQQFKIKVLDDFVALRKLRAKLNVFNDEPAQPQQRLFSSFVGRFRNQTTLTKSGIGAAMIGMSFIGISVCMRNQRNKTLKR